MAACQTRPIDYVEVKRRMEEERISFDTLT